MIVIWAPSAIEARNQVADYIRLRFGSKRKTRFLQDVRETIQLLKSNPNIGQIDPLFDNRTIAYRSVIINGLNKLVYTIEGETINVVAFWDTRREPKSIVNETK